VLIFPDQAHVPVQLGSFDTAEAAAAYDRSAYSMPGYAMLYFPDQAPVYQAEFRHSSVHGAFVYQAETSNSRDHGVRVWLGSFDTVGEAAPAYDRSAYYMPGRYAMLNFPDQADVYQAEISESRDHGVRVWLGTFDTVEEAGPAYSMPGRYARLNLPHRADVYQAEIRYSSDHGMRLWLGTFDTAEEAAPAYDRSAYSIPGRCAMFNIPGLADVFVYQAETSDSRDHGVRVWLGTFDTVGEAAPAYDRSANSMPRWNARFNFPEQAHVYQEEVAVEEVDMEVAVEEVSVDEVAVEEVDMEVAVMEVTMEIAMEEVDMEVGVEEVAVEEVGVEEVGMELGVEEVAVEEVAVEEVKEEKVLNCPRCNSTKFRYYNNQQPRYFCKRCRRFWNEGGLLRSIPVGGGSRKNRPSSSSLSSTSPLARTSVASSQEGAADPDLEAATVHVDSDGDVVTTMCRILLSFVPGASLSRTQVQSLLFLIACLIMTLDLTALCYGQAAGPFFGIYPAARYIILAVILAFAVVALAIVFLPSCSDGRPSPALAKHLLPFAFILFLVTVAVGGFAIPFMSSKV
jgi:hypothetical protein